MLDKDARAEQWQQVQDLKEHYVTGMKLKIQEKATNIGVISASQEQALKTFWGTTRNELPAERTPTGQQSSTDSWDGCRGGRSAGAIACNIERINGSPKQQATKPTREQISQLPEPQGR